MGDAETFASVADAGPIIHLAEIGALSLLKVFSGVHIGDTVWAETVGSGRVAIEVFSHSAVVHRTTVAKSDVSKLVQSHGLDRLHAGECEAIFLCHLLNIPLLLTDDMLAREAARRLRITPVGSLGIVVRAFHNSIISLAQAEQYLFELYETSSLFVTRAIVEIAMEQIRRT